VCPPGQACCHDMVQLCSPDIALCVSGLQLCLGAWCARRRCRGPQLVPAGLAGGMPGVHSQQMRLLGRAASQASMQCMCQWVGLQYMYCRQSRNCRQYGQYLR
jgi:hypothetical protein